jgi:hypothetical protein
MSHQRLDDANADVTVMLSTSVSTLNVLCMVMRSILQLCLLLLKVLRKQASRLCVMILRDEQQQDALPRRTVVCISKDGEMFCTKLFCWEYTSKRHCIVTPQPRYA